MVNLCQKLSDKQKVILTTSKIRSTEVTGMKNIKKLIVGCIGVILTVAVITTGAVAAGGTDRGKGYGSGTGTICRGI